MARTFHCEIVAPEARVFAGAVDFAALPAHDGEVGVLHDRAPLLVKLGIGVLRIRQGEAERAWFVDGGFAQMLQNRLTVLTTKALAPEQIDAGTATAALAAARSAPAHTLEAVEARSAAVARASTQLKLVSHSGY